MFKLIKILNSGVNVPEPQILPKGERAILRGEALILSGGKLTPCPATVMPSFIALADAELTEESAICAAVLPNMLFECPVTEGSPSTISTGAKVCLTQKSGKTVGVNSTTNSGVATVYDTLNASKIDDKILITFR